jgi:SAM-dependent methyltransferase
MLVSFDLRSKGYDTMSCLDLVLRKLNYIGRYMAIGDSIGSKAILSAPYILENRDRITAEGVNIQPEACGRWNHMVIHEGNAHDMKWPGQTFDVVLCCMMLEHDPHFWKTLSEARRILRPGGIFIAAVPTYLGEESKEATSCYKVHGLDFYRFGMHAIHNVIMEGFVDINAYIYGSPPRVLAHGTIGR